MHRVGESRDFDCQLLLIAICLVGQMPSALAGQSAADRFKRWTHVLGERIWKLETRVCDKNRIKPLDPDGLAERPE